MSLSFSLKPDDPPMIQTEQGEHSLKEPKLDIDLLWTWSSPLLTFEIINVHTMDRTEVLDRQGMG